MKLLPMSDSVSFQDLPCDYNLLPGSECYFAPYDIVTHILFSAH